MYLWELVIVSISLSLEIFNIAANKGANQRQMPSRIILLRSLLAGCLVTIILVLGMMIAIIPQCVLQHKIPLSVNMWFSAVILFFVGIKIIWQIKKNKGIEEHLEENITCREVGTMALKSGCDAVLLGMVFGFLQIGLTSIYLFIFCIISLAVGLGLWMGQRKGSVYRNFINICSSILLFVAGIKVIYSFFKML